MLTRAYGQPADAVSEKLDWLIAGGLDVIEVDEVMARAAGQLRAARYQRTRAAISLADAFAATAAAQLDARLATSDPALATVAVAEGVEVVPLPDSRGRRPIR